jgi:hypothetical protein
LNTTPAQDKLMEAFLADRIKPANGSKPLAYDLLTNSCSSTVADALNVIGIETHGPWQMGTITPADVARNLPKTGSVVEIYDYEKNK